MLDFKEAVLENKNFIYSIASKFKGSDIEDLFQVGVLGIEKACENYDENFNTKFTSFAYMYIYGEMAEYVRKNKPIKISREISSTKSKIHKAQEVLEQINMKPASIIDLSLYLDTDESKIVEAINSNEILSIDFEYESGEKSTKLSDSISYENKDIDKLIDLRNELERLDELERQLIEKRYFEDLTQSETAKEMGMSQVQVSRKETKILSKLYSRCA